MKKFNIRVTYQEESYEVYANSLEEAKSKTIDLLPICATLDQIKEEIDHEERRE